MTLPPARFCLECLDAPIRPSGTAIMVVEDEGTPDECRFWMHPECYDRRMALLGEITAALNKLAP